MTMTKPKVFISRVIKDDHNWKDYRFRIFNCKSNPIELKKIEYKEKTRNPFKRYKKIDLTGLIQWRIEQEESTIMRDTIIQPNEQKDFDVVLPSTVQPSIYKFRVKTSGGRATTIKQISRD